MQHLQENRALGKCLPSEMQPKRSETQNVQRNNPNYNNNRTQQPNNLQQPVNARRVRNIQQSNPDNNPGGEEERETETIDEKQKQQAP